MMVLGRLYLSLKFHERGREAFICLYDFDLVSGRYVIDAKSIMGIFSLDLSKPIDLNIHADDNVDEIMAMLKPYLCD